jgi:fructose PTS system EIIA component
MAVVLADLLDEKQIALDLRGPAFNQALNEIVQLLAANGRIADAERFHAAVLERERTSSTVAEHGIAFPHARTALARKIVLGIGRSQKGVRFPKANDLVHLMFVIGVPQQMIQDYLVCVGTLARLANDGSIRGALLEAKTAAEFGEQLRSASLLLQ